MSTRAEISGGAIFLPCASTQASPLSALTILYGTILMSRCTTSSSNLRPMSRLIANRVFCGLVTAWRLAGWPTTTSPSLVKASIEGVVRSPSLFSITRGLPPSMMATHELVVPRSMPITFAMGHSENRESICLKGDSGHFLGVPPELSSPGRLFRDDHPGRAQKAPVELIPRLDHLQDRVRLGGRGLLGHHGLVAGRVEGLPLGVDGAHTELLQRPGQQLQGRFLALLEAAGVRAPAVLDRQIQAVLHRQELRGELLQAVAVGGLDIALGAFAHVVELGHRAQVLLPVVLGALLGLSQRLLQALELDQLGRG